MFARIKKSGQHQYLCLNVKQARKEALDRQVIVDALKQQLKKNPKALIGNKGYRKYLKLDRDHPQPTVLKFLEEPADVLSEGLHRLNTFLIGFHLSRVTTDPHVPIA